MNSRTWTCGSRIRFPLQCLWSKSGEWGPIRAHPPTPLCLGSVHAYPHPCPHCEAQLFWPPPSHCFMRRGRKGPEPRGGEGQVGQDVRPENESTGGPRAEGSHPAALRGSLAVSDDIRSNHPKLWSRGAQAVSWNKNQLHTHRYTDMFWKLREGLISLLWPNIFSFKRLWMAPESTVSSPESIRTASYSFLPSTYLAGKGLVAGCRGHRVPRGPHHLSGPGTEAGIHLWQSSLMPCFSHCHCQVS